MENTLATSEQRQAKQLDELNDLRDKQIAHANGDENAVKYISANRDSKYKIKEIEKGYVHVALLTRTLDAQQTEFHDETRVVPFQPNSFDQLVASNAFGAYSDATVIHDPRANAPKVYNLKPFEPKKAVPLIVQNSQNEAALAAREQKLADQEKRAAKMIEDLQASKKLIDEQKKALDAQVKAANTPGKSPIKPPVVTPSQASSEIDGAGSGENLPPLPQ
jgi:hypothetical protein